MKLFVTLGTDSGSQETYFDLADGQYAKYLGLEMEVTDVAPELRNGPDIPTTGRLTILRQPFYQHGPSRIHTICAEPEGLLETIAKELEEEASKNQGGYVDGMSQAAVMVRNSQSLFHVKQVNMDGIL